MNFQTKFYLIIGSLSTIILLALIWYFLLQVGTIVIYAEAPYRVTLTGYRQFDCRENPCSIRVHSNDYEVRIAKPGYYDMQTEVSLPMLTTEEIALQFVPIPRLIEITQDEMPAVVDVSVDAEEEYFFDLSSQTIQQRQLGKSQTLLPYRSNNKEVTIESSPSGEFILIKDENKLFLGDVNHKRRSKIDTNVDVSKKAAWSPSGMQFAYTTNDGKVVIHNISSASRFEFAEVTNIQYYNWINDEQLLFMTNRIIGFVDSNTQQVEYLLQNMNIRPDFDSIVISEDRKVIFIEDLDGKTYKVNMLE